MRPASAAPAADSAGIPAAPTTPASSLPSAGRSRTAVRPHGGSVLPHTPLVELARIAPRLSSPALCPSRQKAIYCRIFTPVQPAYSAASTEGFSLRRLHQRGSGWTDALRELHPGERMYTFWDYLRNAWER